MVIAGSFDMARSSGFGITTGKATTGTLRQDPLPLRFGDGRGKRLYRLKWLRGGVSTTGDDLTPEIQQSFRKAVGTPVFSQHLGFGPCTPAFTKVQA
jgi:hypothetical protein